MALEKVQKEPQKAKPMRAGVSFMGFTLLIQLRYYRWRPGWTLGELAAGIADSTVTLAAKAHLRNGRPLIITVSTNDALASSAKSIGALMDKKH